MAKYKVGDKVKVRKDLIIGEQYGDMIFLNSMAKFCGKTVTITCVNSNRWYGNEGYRDPFWSDETFEGLAVEEKPSVNLYEKSCWYCRKGGLVDLYLAGAMGICPSCGRVCNNTLTIGYEAKNNPIEPSKRENKPLTIEELLALPEGTKVFTVWLDSNYDKELLIDDMTCWRTKRGDALIRNKGHVLLNPKRRMKYNVYLEKPEGAVDSGK